MVFFRKNLKGKKVVKRRSSMRKAVSKRTNKSLVKLVKNVIHQQAETKQAYISTGDSLVKFNSGINSTGDMIQVLPNINLGTADNARIGDQIRAQSLNIRGYVRIDPSATSPYFNNAGVPNVMARLMVVSLKTKQNFTEATSSATPLNGLLKKGGTTTAFTGVLSDIYVPINTDLWTIHADRKMYLTQDYVASYGGVTAQLIPQDFKDTIKFFNINVKCKNKLLKYDSNISSALLPTNFAPILLLGYSFMNGDAPDVLLTKLGLQFDATLNYEDS